MRGGVFGVIGIGLCVFVGLIAPAGAAVLQVPEDYATITAAVEAANDWDVIELAPGVYSDAEDCDVSLQGKMITIRSSDPSDPSVVASTVIDCDWYFPRRAFSCTQGEGPHTVIDGITFQNGDAPIDQVQVVHWDMDFRAGGAILCVGSSPTIRRCVFEGNLGRHGGAIACFNGGNPLVVECAFRQNEGEAEGGAVFTREAGITFESCVFEDNIGGAVACGLGEVIVKNCTFAGNSATEGGAVSLFRAEAQIEGSVLRDNAASRGGAIYSENSILHLRGSTLEDNDSSEGGGAIAASGSELELESNVLAGNWANGTEEAGFWIDRADRYVSDPDHFALGVWHGKYWVNKHGPIGYAEGSTFHPAGNLPPDHIFKKQYLTESGFFLFTRIGYKGYILKSPDGLQDFEVKLANTRNYRTLHRSLVDCGPTDTYPDGVLFYFEYVAAPKVYCSTDAGETWFELFQAEFGAIAHFHGAVFAPGVGPNEGRLFVMTGDQNYESSILICDDIDDLIANPEVWRHRWGLDVPYQHVLDPEYTINNNLNANNVSTDQAFRAVDILVASDGYAYWGEDSIRWLGQRVFRVNLATSEVEPIGTYGVMGPIWTWHETLDGVILFAAEAYYIEPFGPARDEFLRLYMVLPDGSDYREIGRWMVTNSAEADGEVAAPFPVFEHNGDVHVAIWRGFVNHGDATVVGRIAHDVGGGGAIQALETPTTLRNNTFSGNRAYLGGGVSAWGSDLAIENTILWDELASTNGTELLRLEGTAEGSVLHSVVRDLEAGVVVEPGATLDWQVGNQGTDPLLVDAGHWNAHVWEEGDYHLQSDSDCIGAGDSSIGTPDTSVDIDGEPRFGSPSVDIGADEWHDCDGDGIPDYHLFATGEAEDCNGNAVPDACDIADGSSSDADGDNVPDECQPDCNTNGLPDAWEITTGAAEDCDANGIPDACDMRIPVFVWEERPYFAPFDVANPQTVTISRPPVAVGDVTLRVRAVADIGSTNEFVDVSINGMPVGTLFEIGAADCTVDGDTASLVIPSYVFNEAIEGNAEIRLAPSGYVGANVCSPSWVGITLFYDGYESADCNGNGTLDSCDIASGWSTDANENGIPDECEVDCNGNGFPDVSDPFGDLDLDGDVDGTDFGLFMECLSDPCPYPPCHPPLYGELCCMPADADGDGAITLRDYAGMQEAWTGPSP